MRDSNLVRNQRDYFANVYTLDDVVDGRFETEVDYALICAMTMDEKTYKTIEGYYNTYLEEMLPYYMNSKIKEDSILETLVSYEADKMSKVIAFFYWAKEHKPQLLLANLLKPHKRLETAYKMTKSFNQTLIMSELKEVLKVVYEGDKSELIYKPAERFLTMAYISKHYNVPMYKMEDYPKEAVKEITVSFLGLISYYITTVNECKTTNRVDTIALVTSFQKEIEAYKKAWSLDSKKVLKLGHIIGLMDTSSGGYRANTRMKEGVIPELPKALSFLFHTNHHRIQNENEKHLTIGDKEYINTSTGTRLHTVLSGNSLLDIEHMTITQQELDFAIAKIIYDAYVDQMNWVYSGGQLLTYLENSILIRDYQLLRVKVLETNKLDLAGKMSEALKDVRKENNDLTKQLQKATAKLEKTENKLKDATVLLDTANRELKRNKQENEKQENNKKELQALREMLYRGVTEQDVDVEEPTEDVLNKLKDYKLYFIGGHTRWAKKLQRFLPHIEWFDGNEHNRSFQKLKSGHPIVVVNTATNSHSLTQKVLPIIESNENATLIYIDNNYGLNRLLDIVNTKIEA